MLPLDDSAHGGGQRLATHTDGLDEALGGIHLFLGIEQRLLHLATHVLLVGLIFVEGIGERLRHMQLRDVAHVQRERHRAVVLCVDDEVGRNLLDAASYHLAHRRSWFGIQLAQLADECLALQVSEL